MIPAISLVGRSGSGKTTFLEKLIPLLAARGYRLGVVKQAHHTSGVDKRGKDSHRLREAGASQVVLNAPTQMALIRQQAETLPMAEVLDYFREVDLILIEGYRGEGVPKMELFRAGASSEGPLYQDGLSIVALITDEPGLEPAVPRFSLDDTAKVFRFIEDNILRP
ncbi:MAG: molybdopterin-guanine dinucleotide biosynthesis protein B [bacterium]|nr:molybdopterin-guanine dinucleotide biosynthesis protein B [bacterium]